MIRFGIISFAHMHASSYAWALNCIEKGSGAARLVACADDDRARAESKAKEFHCHQVFSDYRELLTSGSVDAVIITSENSRHCEQVLAAAQSGVHILCEKPIGIAAEDLLQMESALARSSSLFYTAFVCRYSGAVIEARKVLATGSLGRIKAISATNHGQHPGGWFEDRALSGGGAIIDHTVHAADLVRLLTADEFEKVRAFQGKNIKADCGVEDNALIYGQLRRTKIPVSIDCSWSRPGSWPAWGDLVLNIICERGALRIDAFRSHIELGNRERFQFHKLGENLNESLIQGFCDAVAPVPPKSPTADDFLRAEFADGKKSTQVALAAYASVARNGAVVSVAD